MNQKTSNRISLDESKIIRQSRHATRELSLLNTDRPLTSKANFTFF